MNPETGVRFTGHAQDQMRARGITEQQVIRALRTFHTSHPAERRPGVPGRARIYVATIDGRNLRVYVQSDSQPPLVRTVAWMDERP